MAGPQLLDMPTALRLAGLLYLLVPLTVYLVLRRRHDCQSLIAWCSGASLYGLGYLFIGLRDSIPDWASIHLANLMLLASFSLRASSLRSEGGHQPGWHAGGLLVVLGFSDLRGRAQLSLRCVCTSACWHRCSDRPGWPGLRSTSGTARTCAWPARWRWPLVH